MSNQQSILHVTNRLDGYGGARMPRQLAAAQAKSGHSVAVAALTADRTIAAELEARGVGVVNLSSRWRIDPLALRRLMKLRRQVQAKLVHCWDLESLLAVVVTRAGKKARLIASLDAVPGANPLSKRLLPLVGHRVDAWAASDEATALQLRKQLPSAVVNVIRSGVECRSESPKSCEKLRCELDVPKDALVIAVAGPLERRKEIDETIWHFELVRVLHENARLLIFGDGPDRERLERFAEEVSDPGCVRFLGYRNDYRELLPAADVYWQLDASPTTPLALLEAQAAGVPVIASDIPSHRAAVTHEETGLLVPHGVRAEIARATDRLLTNYALTERLAKNAAASVAAKWNAEDSIRAYERLYELALAESSG
jgi:glycosyltransferase involved in cell wall biosynthesis